MKKILSLLLSIILVFSAISYVGAEEETDKAFAAFACSFDSANVVSSLTSQTTYYTYNAQNGVDGRKGVLYMPALAASYGGFMSLDAKKIDIAKTYKLTFAAKKEGTDSATITPVARVDGSNIRFTNTGLFTQYTVGQSLFDVSASLSLGNKSVTAEWKKYEYLIDFNNFTYGSNSVVTVESLGDMQLILRGSGAVCVDNMVIEPVYEYTEILDTSKEYYEATEMMSQNRTITSQNSSLVTGYDDKEKDVVVTGGAIGSGKAIYVSGGGKDGDGALLVYGKGTDRTDNKWIADGIDVAFVYGDSSYGMTAMAPDTVYKFTIRAKAPVYSVPTDTSALSDNTVHINGSNGAIQVNDGSLENGIIGKPLEFRYTHRRNTDNENTIGVFTGYLDAEGNYVSFTDNGASLTSATLTTDWIDYVGYFKPTQDATRWPSIKVSVNTTDEGCFMIDEMSIKEMKYKDGDLVPNGDFSIISGEDAFLYEENATLTQNGTYGNFITVTQGETQNSTQANKILGLVSGNEYVVSFYAKSDAANGTAYATLGGTEFKNASQTLTADWQKYEFNYTHDGTTNPEFKIFADCIENAEYATFSVADISIAPATEAANNRFTNLEFFGETNENHTVGVNFNYITDEENYYIVRISSGNDEVGYFPVFEKQITDIESVSYTIDSYNVGKNLMAEVFAIGETTVVSKIVSDVVKGETVIESQIDGYNNVTGELTASAYVENNSASGENLNLFAFLIVTDSDNRMIGLKHCDNITLAKGEENTLDLSVNVSETLNPMQARIYVWEGSDIFNTEMSALSNVEVYEFN